MPEILAELRETIPAAIPAPPPTPEELPEQEREAQAHQRRARHTIEGGSIVSGSNR
jgi:hypothetical protein